MDFSTPHNSNDDERDPFTDEDDGSFDSDLDADFADAESPTVTSSRRAGGSGGGSGRSSRSRGGGRGSGGNKQQLLIRRAMALGAGLLVLLLLVLGAKGCLDARKNRSLEDYANNVTQIVNETNALGQSFLARLSDPGQLSVTEFNSEIQSDRSAMDGFLSRVQKLDTPGDMEEAQSTLLLVYELRASAMGAIADRMSTATGKEGAEQARRQIAAEMRTLVAADVVYNRVTRHEIDDTIASNGADAPPMPRSTFITNPADWISVDAINDALDGVSGTTSTEAPDDGLTHGTGIDDPSAVMIGGTALNSAATTTIPAGTDPTIDVTVTNQGTADETDVTVTVTVDGGSPLEQSIPEIAAGATGTASIPLTPAPSGQVTIDVKVEAVPGEAITTNNEASFTVDFG